MSEGVCLGQGEMTAHWLTATGSVPHAHRAWPSALAQSHLHGRRPLVLAWGCKCLWLQPDGSGLVVATMATVSSDDTRMLQKGMACP